MILMILSLLFVTFQAFAKPLVLISYFDAFSRAPFNNSERIAKSVAQQLNLSENSFQIQLCPLNTVFEKAYPQLEGCLKALPTPPILTLSLGETGCELKLETMARNKDHSFGGPDNAGAHRSRSPIIPNGAKAIGMRYPLPQMYCALEKNLRYRTVVSSDAGSFVCNNVAYQMAHYYPELIYGFIHVPSHHCSNLNQLNHESIMILSSMISRAVKHLQNKEALTDLPHEENDQRLPTTRKEIKSLREKYQNDVCLNEFFQRAKSL